MKKNLCQFKFNSEENMTKNSTYSIPFSCDKGYKVENIQNLKVKLEEYQKAIIRGKTMKSGMADHVLRENSSHKPLWNDVKLLDRGSDVCRN